MNHELIVYLMIGIFSIIICWNHIFLLLVLVVIEIITIIVVTLNYTRVDEE